MSSAIDPEARRGGRRRASTSLAAALLFGCCGVLLAACGAGAPSEPQSPAVNSTPTAPAPTTVEGALAELDRYEGEIHTVFGGAHAYAQAPGVTAQPVQPAPMPAPSPSPPEPQPGQAARSELTSDPCAIACRALASMGRAAEHLCGLAGESDPRCGSARLRFQAAEQRVKAQCPACV